MHVIFIVLIALSGFFAGVSPAHALVPEVAGWASGDCKGSDPVSVGICALTRQHHTGDWDSCSVVSQTSTSAKISCRYIGNGNVLDTTISRAYSCPSNSSNSGGQCVCNATFEEFQSQCVPACKEGEERTPDGVCLKPNPCPPGEHEQGGACVPDVCKTGEIRVNGFCVPDPDLCEDGQQKVDGKCPEKRKCEKDMPLNVVNASSAPTALCDGGCVYMSSNAIVCTVDMDGVRTCSRTYYSNGMTCNDSPGSNNGPNNGGGDNNGGNNNGGGGGNNNGGGGGNNNGGGSGDKDDHKPNIPGTNPDPETGNCPPGTYKANGKCYPNVTDKKPTDDGTTDGKCPTGYRKEGNICIANQPPPDDDKDKEFCKQNPDLSICKKGSFVGSCQSGFQCEGDAVLCALAREQHQNNCKLLDTMNNDATYKSATDGNDQQSADHMRENATQIAVGTSFDQGGFGWSASCPADPEIPLGFTDRSFSIPFSRICGPLGILSLAGVGITLLGCLVWVLGGKKS